MIRPPGAMCRWASTAECHGPLRSTAKLASTTSSAMSRNGAMWASAALLTQTSHDPNVSRQVATSRHQPLPVLAPRHVALHRHGAAPAPTTSATTASAASGVSRWLTTTAAPAAARATAIPLPIPPAAR